MPIASPGGEVGGSFGGAGGERRATSIFLLFSRSSIGFEATGEMELRFLATS
eukprot:NODE_1809_length_754_cov_217.618440_g1515_i0.p5 GENE.NODE_1809_length_754_cov_217.618440_g1515_i0~~NODE_1809_length_754_cov_217.618440_g1515_i0.p5  ORF type:complete len:52 (-),score=1.14 NODE_1809_length_754_cov_217.618440_g1515_i0:332-487(-)